MITNTRWYFFNKIVHFFRFFFYTIELKIINFCKAKDGNNLKSGWKFAWVSYKYILYIIYKSRVWR